MADNPVVLELAAQIVSAHVANNAVAVDQLPKLINDVHRALFSAGQASAKPEKEPAVPINKSVLANHLVCLECGKHFSMLSGILQLITCSRQSNTVRSGTCGHPTPSSRRTMPRPDQHLLGNSNWA